MNCRQASMSEVHVAPRRSGQPQPKIGSCPQAGALRIRLEIWADGRPGKRAGRWLQQRSAPGRSRQVSGEAAHGNEAMTVCVRGLLSVKHATRVASLLIV